jgi:hypothetical protein
MATHHRCEWNCGSTDCDAPRRPPREGGPAINLDFYAGTYGGTRPPAPRRRIDPWLAAAVALYAANIIGWYAWALWHALRA